ncbi:Uu.00g051420.m01.CDS01 [Anthostomella pinea]|uniref:Uu.00g051420.m01.CDS01 n=1 Tax=Anthostomella pinea TaxID=933095 RepID=A0AAI8VTP0_9PEZI|nr:Uu.00g051420.m01.CDS01 [Anthostomella pinea]
MSQDSDVKKNTSLNLFDDTQWKDGAAFVADMFCNPTSRRDYLRPLSLPEEVSDDDGGDVAMGGIPDAGQGYQNEDEDQGDEVGETELMDDDDADKNDDNVVDKVTDKLTDDAADNVAENDADNDLMIIGQDSRLASQPEAPEAPALPALPALPVGLHQKMRRKMRRTSVLLATEVSMVLVVTEPENPSRPR